MDVKIINPFIASTTANIEKVCRIRVRREGVSLQKAAGSGADICCVIGISGEIRGSAVIALPEPLALKIASAFSMEPLQELNHTAMDAIGEVTNIVVGHARNQLVNQGQRLTISTPVFIKGPDIRISAPRKSCFVVAGFVSPAGRFTVSVTIKED